ncbi:hypothetical protein KEJ26_04135 [Candidatus Bathyarchaeota archaeon]|nr:hypothetical protein [Candidatus Bathyarchaeota archaeon]
MTTLPKSEEATETIEEICNSTESEVEHLVRRVADKFIDEIIAQRDAGIRIKCAICGNHIEQESPVVFFREGAAHVTCFKETELKNNNVTIRCGICGEPIIQPESFIYFKSTGVHKKCLEKLFKIR